MRTPGTVERDPTKLDARAERGASSSKSAYERAITRARSAKATFSNTDETFAASSSWLAARTGSTPADRASRTARSASANARSTRADGISSLKTAASNARPALTWASIASNTAAAKRPASKSRRARAAMASALLRRDALPAESARVASAYVKSCSASSIASTARARWRLGSTTSPSANDSPTRSHQSTVPARSRANAIPSTHGIATPASQAWRADAARSSASAALCCAAATACQWLAPRGAADDAFAKTSAIRASNVVSSSPTHARPSDVEPMPSSSRTSSNAMRAPKLWLDAA